VQFDDPIKQKRYDEMIAACAAFDPPLTNDEIAAIQNAVLGDGTVFLRCKFYKNEPPEILLDSSQFAAEEQGAPNGRR
jgi:hypothetical protein